MAKAGGDLAERFGRIGSVDLALLSGGFVRDAALPVDILIVGDINRKKLADLVSELESEEGRELRYTVLSKEDFDYRLDLNDRFLTAVLAAKATVVVGELPKVAA